MKQSLHYTKILGVLLLLMLFAWGNAWAKDFSSYDDLKKASTYNSTTKTYTYTGDVVVKGNISIPSDVTFTIDGSLSITATTTTDVTLTVIGNLIVTKNITISGHREWNWGYKYGYGILNMQGGVVSVGTYKRTSDGNYDLDANGNRQLSNTSTGTITINDYGKINYTSGTSYIMTYNLTQSSSGYINYSGGTATADLYVIGTYTDNATSSEHPSWGFTTDNSKNGYKIIDLPKATANLYVQNGFNLYVQKYDYDGGGVVAQGYYYYAINALESNGVDKANLPSATENVSSLLPIELTSFTAEQNGDNIDIAWTTNSEVNNDFFTVEYSIDGVTFKTLEIVDGAGTTSEIQEYAISVDASLFTGVVYFRLKQTDFNGNYSYSDVIALTIESETEELIVYPNPATDYVTISCNITSAYICDIYGKKIVCSQNGNTFDVAGLSVGTYYVVVTTESGKKVLPFVKE